MQRELEKFTNQARFVQMIIDGKLTVSKKKKLVLVSELKKLGFKPFPKVVDAIKEGELAPIADNDEEVEEDVETGASAYDYLLGVSNPYASKFPTNANILIDAHMVADSRTCRKVAKTNWRQGDRN